MKKILILFPYQWGYNTDYLFYSKLLKEKYEVTYIGYDLNLPAVPADGVKLIQIKHTGKLSIIKLYKTVIREVKSDTYSHLLINYFITCSLLLLLLPSQVKKIVDIRTSFIYPRKLKSMFFNTVMKIETAMFKNITVVSHGVKEFLKLPARTHVLPLGGPLFPLYDKDFNSLRFLYVGTFYDRNIVNTIHAFSRFASAKLNNIDMHYTIIGYGSVEEVQAVQAAIASQGLEHLISYKGTVRYPELNAYFESHNVGVSYIPMTIYYDCQPPTKTFEYMLSGNVVLGTNTTENARVITPENGVLVGDSVEAFYEGMLRIYEQRSNYNAVAIQKEAKDHTWQAIVDDNLIPYLSACRS
jgi:hypothetical protein